MPRPIRVSLMVLLVAIATASAAMLAMPWPERSFSPARNVPEAQSDRTATRESAYVPISKTSLEISALFGYTPPSPPAAPVVEYVPVEIPPAAWAQPAGVVTSEDGLRRYILKITAPRNIIISLAPGETSEGILLAAVEENRLIIEREDKRYYVPLSNR